MSFIASAIINSNAAEDAAEIQAQSAREAQALQEKMYNQQRTDAQPWRDAGGRAVSAMENPDFQRDFTMADFQADPGYAFRMQQGQKAIERSKAAKGLLGSGGTLKALTDYGQGMGAQEYQSAYNRFNADRDRRFGRLSQLSGQGLQATDMTGRAGQNYANQGGYYMTQAGDAMAAGELGAANAWSGAIGGMGKAAGAAIGGMMGGPVGAKAGSEMMSGAGSGGASLGVANKNPYGAAGNWMQSQLSALGKI